MTDIPTTPPGNASTPSGPVPSPAKKKSLGKMLFRLFGVLVVLFIVGLVILFLNLNTLVKAGVVRGGKYATDQDTLLEAANLSLAGGALRLNSLDIKNLQGYSAPKLISMKDCEITVQSSSVFTHTVVIDSIALQGLEITLEQNGGNNNLAQLMEIVKKKTPATGNNANASPGKELKIGKLSLVGSKVHIIAGAPFNLKLDIDLPPLTIDDPTNPDGRPMKIADLIGTILLHLSKQIVENPAVPGNIKDGMKNVTAIVDNLKGELDKGVKSFDNVSKSLQAATQNFDAKSIQDAGKSIQDATKRLQDAEKNIGGMFNQKKDPPK